MFCFNPLHRQFRPAIRGLIDRFKERPQLQVCLPIHCLRDGDGERIMSSLDQIKVASPHPDNYVSRRILKRTAFRGQAQNLDVGRAHLEALHLRRVADHEADAVAVVHVPPLINERAES